MQYFNLPRLSPAYLPLLFLGILLLFVLFHWRAARETGFVTSARCQRCHADHYEAWRGTLHPYPFLPVSSPDARIFGDFDTPNPLVTFKKEDIAFVMGRRWEQVYARKIDGEYYPFPAKWLIIKKKWVPFKRKDWHKTPMSYKCNGCHTTGFDPDTLGFKEFGIGCEACHGPGGLHVRNQSERQDPLCTFCHDRLSPKPDAQDIFVSVSPSLCAQCHIRGTTAKGKVVRSEQFNFPTDFRLGKDIQRTSVAPSKPETDPQSKFWWGNGLSKNRHQEFSDWSRSEHAKSLINLLEKAGKSLYEEKDRERVDVCLRCHSTDRRLASPDAPMDLQNARFGVTCVACHEPHGQERWLSVSERSAAVCETCHIFQEDHPPIFCSSDAVHCVDCHMPRIGKTGGFFSLHSHAFHLVPPTETQVSGIPNSCQNGGCHADRDLDWAITTYERLYGSAPSPPSHSTCFTEHPTKDPQLSAAQRPSS